MANDQPPSQIEDFIAQHVTSAAQLELLLLLQATPAQARTSAQVAAALSIGPAWAEEQLAELVQQKLLVAVAPTPQSPGGYAYAPNDPAVAATIELLAKWYVTHRVTIITLIYSRPRDPLRSFADAFRLRKEKPDG